MEVTSESSTKESGEEEGKRFWATDKWRSLVRWFVVRAFARPTFVFRVRLIYFRLLIPSRKSSARIICCHHFILRNQIEAQRRWRSERRFFRAKMWYAIYLSRPKLFLKLLSIYHLFVSWKGMQTVRSLTPLLPASFFLSSFLHRIWN